MSDVFRISDGDPSIFAKIRETVLAQLHELLPHTRAREIGSTAVEGAIGKGDLDFLVTVPRTDFFTVRATLDAAFDRNLIQLSNEEFQGYTVSAVPDVSVQLTVDGGRFDTFDAFLDVLRRQPEVLQSYNELKRAWDGKPMADYRKHKADFIEAVLLRKS